MLKVCLNGRRSADEHPAVPVTPGQLAGEARRSVEAGAQAVHLHPRDGSRAETLAASEVGEAIAAVREVAGAPVGVSTGAWIEADPERRAALVRGWGEVMPTRRPDFASVNLFEEGCREVFEALLESGIEVEAGLWSPEDARRLAESGLSDRCLRLLLEPVRETFSEEALESAREMSRVLDEAGIETPRLLHGKDATAWPVLRYAAAEGYGMRVGFEDVLTLPGGEISPDNARLVAAAKEATAPDALR